MDDRTKAIIEELQAEIKLLKERIESLERENRQLRQELEKAQKQMARQAAPFRREERKKIPAAEPTNNRAERALRPAVIARKVSCGNKTERGRDAWQILSSIGVTCQQQAIDFVEYLSSNLPLTAG